MCVATLDYVYGLSLFAAEEAFRQEIRDWLKDNLPENWTGDRFTRGRDDPEGMNIYKEFAQRLATKGWVAPHWPKEYGGLGLSRHRAAHLQRGDGRTPTRPSATRSIGVGWAGPTIIVYGTDEQKQRFLPPITAGETMWCQGFSEPNAGSDLANLADAGRPRRRRLRHQRPEDLDVRRALRRLDDPARPHGPGRAEAQGHLATSSST